jgi:hypothetical protein
MYAFFIVIFAIIAAIGLALLVGIVLALAVDHDEARL